jgi:AraC-like DNA-binding protein/CheY-like chemotaxis protein
MLHTRVLPTSLDELRAAKFQLVTAAHHLLLEALPLSRHSLPALERFVRYARQSMVPTGDRESVLLRLLAALDWQISGQTPSLVDRYLSHRDGTDCITRFRRCIEAFIRYRGVGHPCVQRAIAMLLAEYPNSGLRQSLVADYVGMSSSGLSAAFREHTGVTFSEYLRDLRLTRAATLLGRTTASIKEVWCEVGYTDASNFGRDFKERFGASPGLFRLSGDPALGVSSSVADHRCQRATVQTSLERPGIAIVDDDAGTRDTLRTHFDRVGWVPTTFEYGLDAIRGLTCRPPDIVILDLHLADISGPDCLQRLRADERTSAVPVILFSADWDLEEYASHGRKLGAAAISKICSAFELEQLARTLCGFASPAQTSGV